MLTSKRWWYAAAVRAIKTWAQALTVSAATIVPLSAATEWKEWALGVGLIFANAFGAAFLSVLTSLGGLPEVNSE